MEAHKTNIIAAIIIAILLFFTGIIVGNWIAEAKFGELARTQAELNTAMLDFETHYALAREDVCDATLLLSLNQELDSIGKRVVFLKSKNLKDSQLLDLEKQYFLIELKHWMYIRRMNKECAFQYPWVLYFYRLGNCPECTIQGLALTNIKKDRPDVMIYSFNAQTELRSLDAIKQKYDIKGTPALVINGAKYSALNEEEILELLEENSGSAY